MPAQLGEIVRLVFEFTVDGVPTSGLSPAPTVTIYSPAGVALVTDAALTEQAAAARYVYDYTLPATAGLYEARAYSSQANLDSQYMVCAVEAGQAWIEYLDADISTIPTAVWASGARTLTSFGTLIADIWSHATRILTAGTNIVLAKGTGITGFNDLSAAQVNTEVDTALSDVGLTITITGRIDAAISTRATAAEVGTLVNPDLDEPTVPFTFPASVQEILAYMAAQAVHDMYVNKTTGEQLLMDSTGLEIVSIQVVTDDGTIFHRAKAEAAP